jgi:hypothetical protein
MCNTFRKLLPPGADSKEQSGTSRRDVFLNKVMGSNPFFRPKQLPVQVNLGRPKVEPIA